MRIITGIYKGRHFEIPRSFKARPTTDFAKENIFNVLRGYMELEGTTALDLFAGTGSISLELVSRGCDKVISVEADRDHANFIRQCFKKLGTEQDILIRGDVFRFLKSCHQQFDFIFADPPHDLPELPTLPVSLFLSMASAMTSQAIPGAWSIGVTAVSTSLSSGLWLPSLKPLRDCRRSEPVGRDSQIVPRA